MSRYEVDQGRYMFAFGWDPPLQYFFLDIYDKNDETDTPVFDNLNRPDPAMTLEEIKEKCSEYGWGMSATYEAKLLRDRHEDLMSKGITPARPVPGGE